jgi:hypothetical protein
MNMNLKKYINLCLIDDYADKDFKNGFSLCVSSLPDKELNNFLEIMVKHDPIMKELILDRMQELIDEHMPEREAKYKYDSGLKPRVDPINGEVIW